MQCKFIFCILTIIANTINIKSNKISIIFLVFEFLVFLVPYCLGLRDLSGQ